ncbi:autotransporter outer membrane beta-barrel domain-containing protein [Pandoraea sp. PE-S2R-1]|uniref:autotransporter outer membrane beta-barrel domain-containing protein n=1 Tax=Pandoraea sp. PE-S2R-1 TaxID=1986994 RepID=UPI000B402BDA|nr:autotransporter outer membrane beta-barrel domain-containing protein [Pandoraea sp. PE-S2R-1]
MPTSTSAAPRQRVLASAIGLAFATLAMSSQAGTVIGTNQVIDAPGDATETWTVSNTGSLTVNNGAATNWLLIQGAPPSTGPSTLTTDGATIISTAPGAGGGAPPAAITIENSSATISNSTVSSATNAGIQLVGQTTAGLVAPTATVTNSTVSGFQYGISVSSNGVLTLNNSNVSAGTGAAGGINGGVVNFDSTVVATGGTISGNISGVTATTTNLTTETTSNTTLSGVSVSAATGAAIVVQPARPVAAFEGHTANILIEAGSTLTGGNGYALQATGLITANATIDNSTIVGNVSGDGTATLNLTLQNNANLTGSLANINVLAVNSNATWRLISDNTVGTVTMNGGNIDISGTALGTPTTHTLTIATLSGTGTFLMSTNLGTHTGDLLNVTGTATGTYQLHVRNSGGEPTNLSPLTVVQTGGGGAAFSLVGGKVDAGVYSYTLEQQGNNWALVTNPGSPEDPGEGDLTPGAKTVLGLSGAGPTVWYGEAAILRSRLGELRIGDQSNSGVWARAFGKQYNAKPEDGTSYRQTQYGVIGGVDGVVGQAWGGTWLVGAMLGTSHSKLSFDNGSTGGVNSYTAGLYATWITKAGWYFDGLVKFNHFVNSADVIMSDGTGSHGGFNNNGIGATLEFGRHMEFGNRWFVEPYIQASMVRIGGDNFSLDNGMQSSTSHTGSVEARIGAAFGKTIELSGGALLQPYLKLAVIQEFITSNQIMINGINFNNDTSGTRVEFGAGVAAQLRHNMQIYAEVETSAGHKISQPWGAQIGLRYAF